MVFDQGIGDIFTIRVAGHVVGPDVLGSLEFACRIAGASLVLVLGHTGCGAVTGAMAGARLGHLTDLVQKIEPAVHAVGQAVGRAVDASDPADVDAVAEAHVHASLDQIRAESSVLSSMEEAGSIRLHGAMYDVSTGAVRLL